jgi:hypothetical protein
MKKSNLSAKVSIITYDVWGNNKDGYEVNDKFRYGTFKTDISLLDTEKGVLNFLNEVFFNKKVSEKQIDIELVDENITYVSDAKNGKPLLEIIVERH